jgi:hypothetical protein
MREGGQHLACLVANFHRAIPPFRSSNRAQMSVMPNYLKSEGFASHQDLGVFRHLIVPHLNGTANASAIKLYPTCAAGTAQ